MPKAGKNKVALSRNTCFWKGNIPKQNELIKRNKVSIMESWEWCQGGDPLYHTASAPACHKESRRKKLSVFWNAWFFHLSLPYQINVIRNVSIPCKIASDPNLGLEETKGRPLGIGQGSLNIYQAASHSVHSIQILISNTIFQDQVFLAKWLIVAPNMKYTRWTWSIL